MSGMTSECGSNAGIVEDAKVKNEDRALTLEARYIMLLEEKIQRLEREASNATDEPSTSDKILKEDESSESEDEGKGSKNEDEDKENKNEDENKDKDSVESSKDKSRVRYVERKHTLLDYTDTYKKADEWGHGSGGDDGPSDAPIITWRRTQFSNSTTIRHLLIESMALRNALREILDESVEITFDTEEVAIRAPYTILYHSEDKIRKFADDPANKAVKPELDILLEQIQKEQKAARKDIAAYKKNGTITYEYLWALFYPGCRVITTVMEEPQMLVVADQLPPPLFPGDDDDDTFQMYVVAIDWDGSEFQPVGRTVKFRKFPATKSIQELEVCPLEYWKDPKEDTQTPEKLEERLIERGKIFEKLCRAELEKRHRPYEGMAITAGVIEVAKDDGKDDRTVTSENTIDEKAGEQIQLGPRSFVMIDHYSYLNLCKIGPTPLMVGKEEAAWLNPPEWVHWYRRAIRLIGELPRSSEGKPALSKKQLELCPPRVLGFAVSVKKFVQLLVKNIDTTAGADKKKKEQPFDDLELATKTKKTLRKLVEEHSKKSVIEDLIPGKGQGLVVLLHGPPGVGKTLTAESLAILTDKPLYSVSMADIGTSPHTVEFNLRRIFQLATHWKALLLFDEADVFLEARSLTDVRRNSLVSTLLRILEYYEGILFLTSNRVKTFDEAFQSRIHFAVQFSILTEQQRKKIWEMWFKKASDKLDPSFEWQEYLEEEGRLVKEKLNGRQIRNVFRSAMNLAHADHENLHWRHIDEILQRTVSFQNYMLQGEEMARKENLR